VKNIFKIGTLGNDADDPTCSVLAVKSLGNYKIVPFSEFEYAEDALIKQIIDAMVVPGAYPHITNFIMSEFLSVLSAFTFVIPDLVLVSKERNQKDEYEALFNHSATNALVKEYIDATWSRQINVNSNSMACIRVLESTNDCCAITNSACAKKYGLYVHKVIRAGINMPFVIFARNNAAA